MHSWIRVVAFCLVINLAICQAKKQEFDFILSGVIVSVFTPMDAEGNLNLTYIPAYARYLKESGVDGVLLTSLAGEGPNLCVREKKRVYDAWSMCGRPLGLKIVMQIGGGSLPDTLELAEYANKLNADAILVLPTAYSQPTVEDLTNLMDLVSRAAPSIPFLFYDYPEWSNVELDMTEFFKLALRRIKMFRGLVTDFATTLQILARNEASDHMVFFHDYLSTTAAVANGYDTFFIIAMANIAPELCLDIIKSAQNGDFEEARELLLRLIKLKREITARYNPISSMKIATELTSGVKLGNPRLPLTPIPEEGRRYIASVLKKYDLRVV